MTGLSRAFSNASAIERRASSFDDPVKRLRYLRQATAAGKKSIAKKRWFGYFALAMTVATLRSDAISRELPDRKKAVAAVKRTVIEIPNVWLAEQTKGYDLYSNGLRVENELAVSNRPRSYRLVSRETGSFGPLRTQPAGIVFHTTESDQAPFDSTQSHALMRIGHELLLFVRNKQAYHFVIDRFGRVHRIIVESDAANHAGHSVWADPDWAYVGLNDSFIGVAFESRTQSDQQSITEAQLRAGKELTEMLRAKYHLPAENCVVHAQVSVNPGNMRIGWHTDWGAGFPFEQMGLPDNYKIPNPSLYLFGFEYDDVYRSVTGSDLQAGLTLAGEKVREGAHERRLPVADYRNLLKQKFLQVESALQRRSVDEENQHESN
jgi:hypothetical protein